MDYQFPLLLLTSAAPVNMIVFLFALLAVATAEKYHCGQSSTWQGVGSTESRIIGGADAPRNAYPWQVSLERCSTYGCRHSCGAVLISETYIITAAHCVSSPKMSDYNMVLGQYARGEVGANDPRRIVPKSIKTHPRWGNDPSNGFPYEYRSHRALQACSHQRQKHCPCQTASDSPKNYTQNECWISGWGRTSSENNELPTNLQHAKMNVLSKYYCNEFWGSRYQDFHVCIFDNVDVTRSSCNGDSGGPLNCKEGGVWEVVGLTSWGIRDCLTFFPSVYTRTSFFKDWIRQETGVNQEEICY